MSLIWLKVLLLPPDLLKTHAKGYADLASQELHQHWRQWQQRGLLLALCVCSGLLALGLGAVAVLLWAALPALNSERWWVLLVLPLAFALLSICLALWAKQLQTRQLFPKLQNQLQLDTLSLQHSTKA